MKAHAWILVSALVLACGGLPPPEANGERRKEARAQMHEIRMALELHYLQHARYPEELSDLTQPEDVGGRPLREEIPSDPWGHAYVYVAGESETHPSFQLYSRGPDGLEGTDDDVAAPDR